VNLQAGNARQASQGTRRQGLLFILDHVQTDAVEQHEGPGEPGDATDVLFT